VIQADVRAVLLGRAALTAVAAAAMLAAPRPARAYDFTIGLRTIGQGYQVRRFAPTGGDELLTRRRLTQFLNLSIFDIEPDSWRDRDGRAGSLGPATLTFDVSLRFESDFGGYTLGRPTGSDEIRELSQSQIDVLYAVLGGRNVAGFLDFELGRQIHFDLLDFYAFDGGTARLHLRRWLAVEGFGGTEVRGELPLSAPLYELDGTSAGSRDPVTRFDQNAVLRPLAGAALVLGDDGGWAPSPLWLRVAYRRMWSATADRQPGDPEIGINDEKLTLTGSAAWRRLIVATGGARYDLLQARFDDEQLAVRVRLPARQAIVAEQVFQAPTFDGDSIWNVFSTGAYRDLRLSYEIGATAELKLHARGFLRLYEATDDEVAPDGRDLGAAEPGGRRAAGGSAGAEWRRTGALVRCDGYWDGGYGGQKIGLDLSVRWTVRPRVLELEGRLTGWKWRSDQQPATDAGLVGGAQAGGRWELGQGIRFHLLAEDNVGTFYRGQYRALVIVEVDASL
jgi:hypothetical protein